MTDYARLRVLAEVADNASYLGSSSHAVEKALTPDEWTVQQIVDATTVGIGVSLGHLDSCTSFLVENTSTTASVYVEWWSQRGTLNDTVTFAQAATGDTITDDDAGGLYITSGGEAGGYVRLSNCATAGNSTTWLVRSVAASVITLVAEATVTADGGDAITISFERRNKVHLPAGGVLLVTDTIVPAGNLTLTSSTGTAKCKVSFTGT